MFKFKLSEPFKQILFISVLIISYAFLLYNLKEITGVFTKLLSLLTPFFIGFLIAYLVNPVVFLLKNLLKKIFKWDCSIVASMVLAYTLLIIIILLMCILILPQIWVNFNIVLTELPNTFDKIKGWLNSETFIYLDEITNGFISRGDLLNNITANLESIFIEFTSNFSKLISATVSITTFIFNLLLGIIISVYMLRNKEKYKAQTKKCLYALTNKEKADNIVAVAININRTFSRFIGACLLDSLIVGVLCYIGCLVLGIHNALLIAVIIGITNIIPYFGPFLGAIPCSVVVLIQGPMPMVLFIIFILILQQFDSNIIVPKLMNNTLGLPSIWVIFTILFMTGVFGFLGMMFGVPLFTVVYMTVRNMLYRKLEQKGLSVKTEDYINKEVNED